MKPAPKHGAARHKRHWQAFLRVARKEIDAAHTNTPSFHDDGLHATQEPIDEVEEASMESFPASDPPAHRVI